MHSCPLCHPHHEKIIWQNQQMRVIVVEDHPHIPIFCRVIWQEHIAEMTDLSELNRQNLMSLVFRVEQAIRTVFTPDKINLASLGNYVPHIHWHIIARFADDAYFPDTIWHQPHESTTIRLPENNWQKVAQYLSDNETKGQV